MKRTSMALCKNILVPFTVYSKTRYQSIMLAAPNFYCLFITRNATMRHFYANLLTAGGNFS